MKSEKASSTEDCDIQLPRRQQRKAKVEIQGVSVDIRGRRVQMTALEKTIIDLDPVVRAVFVARLRSEKE